MQVPPALPAPVQSPAAEPAARLNTTGRDIALTAPLREGEFILGEIGFVLAADDSLRVSAPRLQELLRPVLDPGRYSQLETALAGLAEVQASQVAAQGLTLRYDPEAIGLVIEIPAEARATRQLSIAQFGDEMVGEFDPPAGWSGYINFRSSLDYVWEGTDKGIQDPLVLMDSAIRHWGVVFENEGSLQIGTQGRNTIFRREGTRFVYDDLARLARWTLGDLQPVSRGFVGTPQLAGLSLVRSYSVLEPQRNVQPRGERTFTIVRPSTVEAFINGQSVRQVRLQPGTYNVRDFPFAQGANNVRLVVTDDAGQSEVIEFSLFFDRTLLAEGLTEFGLFAGIRAPFTGRSRDYQLDEPGASGFIRRGLTDKLTAGANFNLQRRGIALGAEAVAATPLGTIGSDVAVSQVNNIGFGYAINFSLQRAVTNSASGRSFGFTFEHRSKNFATPNELTADNRFLFEVGASYAQSLGRSQFISFTGLYAKGRGAFGDEKTARLSYGYRLSPRLSLAAEGIYEDRQNFGENHGLRLTLVYRPDSRSTAVAEVDTRNERARAGYQTSRGEGVGAWSGGINADYLYEENVVGVDANVSYLANRAELGLNHTTAFDVGGGNDVSDQRTSLRLGTAIAFADGHVALSRPIFDSFAMVAPHRTIRGRDIYIEPRDGNYRAKSGIFGPAVEPDLSSYSERVITYDVPDAPVGYDLGEGNFRVYPPYRSGFLKIAGSDYSVTGIGTLRDQNGQPVALIAGRAFEIGAPDREPITVFTNRSGRFGIQGLRPGRWRIEVPTQPPGIVEIEIPEDTQGVIRLGDLTLGDRK